VTAVASQLPLPLATPPSLTREDFIIVPGNAESVAFVDSWPDWSSNAAALYGPPASGKSHLAAIWAARANAQTIDARALDDHVAAKLADVVVVENIDAAPAAERDSALFALFNRGGALLLTGREPPKDWPVLLPDLASRFSALLAFPLWAPDDALLASLARKLFADRQLRVPDSVITSMIVSLERSPAAIRELVERLDREAMARKCKISVGLLREILPPNA
jgi:chromosomal replication initiation ATPase DnaA